MFGDVLRYRCGLLAYCHEGCSEFVSVGSCCTCTKVSIRDVFLTTMSKTAVRSEIDGVVEVDNFGKRVLN